ncbi:signal peptidase I [Friedmanniella luteola]|uniref:Signal peptidase I n=1 Tax=Friedmanniella luteola TaxID=546871 RepID=A0A1H1TJ25_9ACTN|nr:LamG-like jellyroll fold domain-containing protein [Friedmanniella luteola]SDS60184.1 signal peptidase I [Friedmanniella luteola]
MEQQRPWSWPWLVACTLAKAVLASVLCLGLWGAAPALLGWLPTTVSSGSMLPRLHVGDVAVSRPLQGAAPTLGSVLLFDDPDHPGRLRLHRFVRVDDDGLLVTRGDANDGDDSSPVTLGAVRGVGTLRVPWVGLPVVWARERALVPLGLALVGLVGLALVAGQSRRFGYPDDAEGPPDGGGDADEAAPAAADEASPADGVVTTRAGRAERSARTARRAALAAAGAALLVLVPALPADAAFTGRTSSRAGLAAAPYFTCAGAVTASSPAVWFRLDETTSTATTATDSSRNARNGVYGSAGKATVTDRACARDTGGAMRFDGASGYLSSAQITGTAPQTFTTAVWFKTTATRGGKLVGYGNVQTGASGVFDRHLYLADTGRVVFGVYAGATKTVISPNPYRDGRWHQAVATLSSAGMRLYLDGDLVASDASTTSAEPVSSGYLRVGFDNLDGWPSAPTSRYFTGTLDDVALYLTALSPAQVEAQYEAGT